MDKFIYIISYIYITALTVFMIVYTIHIDTLVEHIYVDMNTMTNIMTSICNNSIFKYVCRSHLNL